MGDVIVVSPSIVRPTEIDLREDSLRGILSFYSNGREKEIAPPAVTIYNKEYLTLDGHNRLAIADLLGISIPVYVADNFGDFMRPERFPLIDYKFLSEMNENIEMRFSYCAYTLNKLEDQGIFSFYQLRQRYGFMDSMDSLEARLKKIA